MVILQKQSLRWDKFVTVVADDLDVVEFFEMK